MKRVTCATSQELECVGISSGWMMLGDDLFRSFLVAILTRDVEVLISLDRKIENVNNDRLFSFKKRDYINRQNIDIWSEEFYLRIKTENDSNRKFFYPIFVGR